MHIYFSFKTNVFKKNKIKNKNEIKIFGAWGAIDRGGYCPRPMIMYIQVNLSNVTFQGNTEIGSHKTGCC